jgi:hypothetical protein
MNNKSLIEEVEELFADIRQTHRYSTGRIYALYNRVFGTNEKPQTCFSCLLRKVNKLKRWREKR